RAWCCTRQAVAIIDEDMSGRTPPGLCGASLGPLRYGRARSFARTSAHRIISALADKVGRSVLRNPLLWALPLQATLLLWSLDLLDPWGDEWFTLKTISQPVSQLVSTVAENIHPPLYFVLLHYWVQLPWTLSLVASTRA